MPQKSNIPWLIQAIKSHHSDECLLWPFATNGRGYGRVTFEGRGESVHRLAFKFVHGHWPTPVGRHTCDNPPCFNPRHIIEGTKKQDREDAVARDRTARKLEASLVRKIRAEYIAGHPIHGGTALARKYGVSSALISLIVRRILWRHI